MFHFKQLKQHQSGFSIIEIIIILLILSIGFLTMLQFYRLAISQNTKQQNEDQAIYLASAGLEAVRQIRDRDWNILTGLANNTSYQLRQIRQTDAPIIWQLVPGNETIGQFQRQITLGAVNRDSNANIITSGGTFDDETRQINTTIIWQEANQTRQINLSTYLTAWTKY